MLLWQAARKEAQEITKFTPVRDNGLEDLARIAATLGAQVHVYPLDPGVSGVIRKHVGQDPEIFINADESMPRKRFTLAHEIGHLIERINVADDPDFSFVDYRATGEYNLHEFFADEFAGELLMPAEQFLETYESKGEYGTSLHFGVSVPAVRKRLARLKKNPPEAQ